jgi:tripartite-type tricarboxylate transporter receptor subunit TctC
MKRLAQSLIAAFGLALSSAGLQAADWTPPGPIKLMIAFGAGGGADTQARLIASAMEEKLGGQFIPEQVTGKGGLNMLTALAKEPADGTAIGMAVTESLGYNLLAANTELTPASFTGLSSTAGFQLAIVGRAADGWKTMHDVIEAAKGGKQIRLGTMSPRLEDLTYLMEKANDVSFNTVGYKGGKLVLDAINAGDVDVGFVAGPQGKGVAAGDLVELASALSGPLNATPDAPLLSDLGVPFNAEGQFVFVAPGGLPEAAQTAIGDAIEAVVTDPDQKVAQIIKRVFGGAQVIKGADLQTHLQSGYDSAGELIKAVGE